MDQNYTYAGIIIKSFNEVIENFATLKVLSTDVRQPEKSGEPLDIIVLIGIVGDINAKIYMSMTAGTGMALAREMLGDMEINGVDELVFSAAAELCNIVMGHACSGLTGQKLTVDITPPVVLTESGQTADGEETQYSISILLNDQGFIGFDVAPENIA